PLVIYRHQVLKQADVVLALFLRGEDFTAEQKRLDFEYYDPLTTGDSTLSAVVQSIIAAEIGRTHEAFEHFSKALVVDLADVHGNASDGVHIASTGGVWSALVCGFGGMRDPGGDLHFDPRFPEEWDSLSFKLTRRGSRIHVKVTATHISFEVETGDVPVDVVVQGEPYTVVPDERLEVPINSSGQSAP
ncbi:glycosyl hydrolase family 65 protein, partial [Dietzia sp.]|uniref:glycosyl hydrolase family 65 protein n=1 Tax=Dietzia sp. TaxID=1871616 RepID=UPI002FD8B090